MKDLKLRREHPDRLFFTLMRTNLDCVLKCITSPPLYPSPRFHSFPCPPKEVLLLLFTAKQQLYAVTYKPWNKKGGSFICTVLRQKSPWKLNEVWQAHQSYVSKPPEEFLRLQWFRAMSRWFRKTLSNPHCPCLQYQCQTSALPFTREALQCYSLRSKSNLG